jgi:hypothetical protein
MRDDLVEWCRVREQVDWAQVARPAVDPVVGRRDGVVDHVRASRDVGRTERLLTALQQVRDAASAGLSLSFDLLCGWQTTVLGEPVTGFRTGPAFAKSGRERYGLHPGTTSQFDSCLAQATDPRMPLAARAARVYLDVAFFHPFLDGNARAAMLCLYFVLLRDHVVIDLAAPTLRVVRRADDMDGAVELVRLIDVLIGATRRRATGPASTHRDHAYGGRTR